MQAKCFECGEMITGEDTGAVEDAMLRHGRERHGWTYPEQAVRNYARNYVEAAERLTGGTVRLDASGPVDVRPVGAERVDDWLAFFDHDGFAGNPDWASCYCLEAHEPAPPDMPERPWRQSRATMVERFKSGTTFGYLAYAEGRPAGWVNASLRADFRFYSDIDPSGPPPRSVVSVSCFVIAPPFRRHGVASALLDHVVADAGSRGALWIEGYPHNAPREGDAGHFRGPRSLYEARGFMPVEVRERFTVMRRPVG